MILNIAEYKKLVNEFDKINNMDFKFPELTCDPINKSYTLDFNSLDGDQKETVNKALGV